jgi:outer membrane protein assembly factor BamA
MNFSTRKIFMFLPFTSMLCMLQFNGIAQKTAAEKPVTNLIVHYKDSIKQPPPLSIKTSFAGTAQVNSYISSLPALFTAKGYLAASVDSLWQEGNNVHINFYVGRRYSWIQLRTNSIDKTLLSKIGYSAKNFSDKPINVKEIDLLKERLLSYYENEGFPFAAVYLDSVTITDDKIAAALMVNKGLVYRVDSITNYGKLKLNPTFLQRYLNIANGSVYNREKLKDVDKRMLELPYAQTEQPSTLNMLGSGSILNLYVNNKKSSEVSAIFGFLPDANNTGKLQVTGDVNIDLKNVFGAGESLLFKYQALQPKSPRLNLGYEKPYFLKSPFGLGFLFELFKKDSSFLQVNAQLALQLNLSNKQLGKIIVQWQTAGLLQGGVDTNAIKFNRQLPANVDVKSVNAGISYEFRNTNYKFNPLTGSDVSITALTGIKNIRKNNDILSLKTSGFNYESLYDSVKLKSYQLRLKVSAAHYFKLTKSSTFKTALNTGLFSSPNIFRNEVFQIGGYRLLRGFDEESIYATKYAVLTAEYRSLLGLNSYLFGFLDIGITGTKYQNVDNSNFFTGTGLGIAYETKAGLLNLSLALGKRNDVPFNIRQAAKIHFGYVNYF